MGETTRPDRLTVAEGTELVHYAVAAVSARLRQVGLDGRPPASLRLRALGASFVTLEAQGRLRGCVGSLERVRPLFLDVARNARRAMADPRLDPVTELDWPLLDISVAVLSRPELIPATDRDALLSTLRPGVDGLILQDDERRATFLPAVWDKIPDPARFVGALLIKGGWPAEGWPSGVRAARYTSEEYEDPAPRTRLE